MHRRPGIALLLWPALALAGSGPHAPAGAPAQGKGPVEVVVAAVLPMDAELASVLVLREKHGSAVLPIFVARSEGAAIDGKLRGGSQEDGTGSAAAPVPGTNVVSDAPSDLLGRAIAVLGGKVTRVEIQVVQEALFRAQVTLDQGGKRLLVEARPSDSVALALTWNAPIFATREVMDKAALSPADVERMRKQAARDDADEAQGPESRF